MERPNNNAAGFRERLSVLTSSMEAPERILLYGQEGTGKTRAVFSIAKKMRQTKSSGCVHLVDLDFPSHLRMKTGFPGCEENMKFYTPDNFSELLTTLSKIHINATKDDWLCVDGMGEGWILAQEDHAERFHKKDLVSWQVEGGGVDDRGRAASQQKAIWHSATKLFRTYPGNVLCCSPSKQVMLKSDKTVMDPKQSRYVEVGWQPEGQNMVGFLFHTVIYTSQAGDRFLMWTVKDRERELMRNKVVGDFVTDYLMKVGGWTL